MSRLSISSYFLFYFIWISGGIEKIHGREYVVQSEVSKRLQQTDCNNPEFGCDEQTDNCPTPDCFCDVVNGYICRDIVPPAADQLPSDHVPSTAGIPEEICDSVICIDDDDIEFECPGHCFCEDFFGTCEECSKLGCGLGNEDICPDKCYCDVDTLHCKRLTSLGELVNSYPNKDNRSNKGKKKYDETTVAT